MEGNETQESKSVPESPKAEAPASESPKADPKDAEENKVMAIVGYIIPILFFVPMLAEKKSPFGMYHSNQQLALLIALIAVQVVGGLIPFIGWFVILPLGSIAVLVLIVIGVISAAKGEMKPLPVIGGYSLIK